jgi:hypothetical protein
MSDPHVSKCSLQRVVADCRGPSLTAPDNRQLQLDLREVLIFLSQVHKKSLQRDFVVDIQRFRGIDENRCQVHAFVECRLSVPPDTGESLGCSSVA